MMRRASRIAASSAQLPVPVCGLASAMNVAHRLFGSNYSADLGHYKRPYSTESRSAAHRHPPRNAALREQQASGATGVARGPASTIAVEEEVALPPSSPKNHYPGLYKKSTEDRLSFTSNFREPDVQPILDAAKSTASPTAAAELDDTDVTRIYSKEEVRSMEPDASALAGEVMAAPEDDVLDALSEEPETAALKAAMRQRPMEELSFPAEAPAAAADDDGDDEFAEIRSHPFFMDMLRRAERSMIRFRKETRALGRYSVEAVNECVRPLLQVTDYPLTANQLSHLSHSISPAVLRSSLRDRAACLRLQLYRSPDTDLLLDWSNEDFLRRRYESVHLSWEPMDVICRRFGWTDSMMTDRDCLLYFSAFPEYVEMAELKTGANGQPVAVPIKDPVTRAADGGVPAKLMLLRRRQSPDVEPSLTESIRLMGTPAVSTPAKGRRAQRMRQTDGDSIADYFEAVDASAAAVEGTPEVRLQHAVDTVPPLRQASRPNGRTIREFSVPKSHAEPQRANTSETKPATTPAPASRTAATPLADGAAFDQRKFETLSNAYHNAKVEVSLLRRRMLDTDSADKAQAMEIQLSKGRREVTRMEQELERMRESKRHASAADGNTAATTAPMLPGMPQYPVAPEFSAAESSKKDRAAGDIEDDVIEQALKAFKEEEELIRHGAAAPRTRFTQSLPPTTTAAAISTPQEAQVQPGNGEEYEMVEVEVDDDEELQDPTATHDLTAAEEAELEADDLGAVREADVPIAAPQPAQLRTSAQRTQPWQDELEAAVEAVEAEQDEAEEEAAVLSDAAPAATPAERLAQLSSLHDRLSSAAERARRYLATVEHRRQEVLKKLDCQLVDATRKVEQLEERLEAVATERAAVSDAIARAEVERKARVMEAELNAQREQRMTALAEQRERAEKAQEAAARAMEQQRQVEQEALAMEEELQRRLSDVQERLRAMQNRETVVSASAPTPVATAVKPKAEEAVSAPRVEQSATSSPSPSSTATSAGQFMCTPEQYDGLHLAADRLRKEITALEAQMEDEGDEDDETLMAVLAASRADLEELEECVTSVRTNASWAAARDATRASETARTAQVTDTAAHRLQSAIDQHRFQISLLEKRLAHASQRAVTAKLRDRIAQGRRAINQLRVEQDRLRRLGRDSLGLPASMSIAETLAHEGKEAKTSNAAAQDAAPEEDAAEDVMEATTEREREEEVSVPTPDAEKLRLRLDSMVEDIQHLQDSIEAQERTPDFDDEEAAGVLQEMKEKLSQLLRLRDQVQRALLEESANGTAGAQSVVRRSSGRADSATVVGRGQTVVRAGPSRLVHVPSSARKVRGAVRSAMQR